MKIPLNEYEVNFIYNLLKGYRTEDYREHMVVNSILNKLSNKKDN